MRTRPIDGGSISFPADLEKLNSRVRGLIGHSCWQAYLSYPEELVLELGDKRPKFSEAILRRRPEWADAVKGSWRVDTSTSRWLMGRAGDVLARYPPASPELEAALSAFVGRRVEAASVRFEDLGLAVAFDDELALFILPEPASELRFWAVGMPDATLIVGPGRSWELRSVHVSET